jgi:hypothetical protein
MGSGPHKVIERVAGVLIPIACREEILGDMRQRHQSTGSYVLEAVHTIPCVIYSRIRRTTDAVLAVAEGCSMLTAFVMAAWLLERGSIADQGGLLRLAIPAAVVLVMTILADAYSDPRHRWALKPLVGPAVGGGLAYILQSMLGEWALPPSVFLWGSAMSLLLLCALRLMFPPIADRPQTVNIPAFWQKLELSPPSAHINSALLPAAILIAMIAMIFYLVLK